MAGVAALISRHKLLCLQLFTLLRIPLAMLFAVILIFSDKPNFLVIFICLVLIGLIELTDLLDGYIARRLGIVTEWGAMLDPYADSISRLIVYWAFAVSGLVIPLVPIAMAFRDITVAYCRITLTRFGSTVSALLSGKIKAWVQGVGASIIIIGPLYWKYTGEWTVHALSWIVIISTLASIVEYTKSAVVVSIRETRKDKTVSE